MNDPFARQVAGGCVSTGAGEDGAVLPDILLRFDVDRPPTFPRDHHGNAPTVHKLRIGGVCYGVDRLLGYIVLHNLYFKFVQNRNFGAGIVDFQIDVILIDAPDFFNHFLVDWYNDFSLVILGRRPETILS